MLVQLKEVIVSKVSKDAIEETLLYSIPTLITCHYLMFTGNLFSTTWYLNFFFGCFADAVLEMITLKRMDTFFVGGSVAVLSHYPALSVNGAQMWFKVKDYTYSILPL